MIYKPESVHDQPDVMIQQWSIKELPDGDRHLVGVVPVSGHDGRVTSKIVDFAGRIITTRSGRRYHLDGPSGGHPNAGYTWSVWCGYNAVDASEAIDVTAEYECGRPDSGARE